jgi:hypothetical protein
VSPSIYSRRPLLRGVLLAAATGLAVFVAFALSMYIAGEQTEVAVLRTFDADGRPHDTKLWVVDDGASAWVRVARPERRWLARLESIPGVELTRHGATRSYRAIPVRDAATRARVDQLMAEKYGRADWWYGLVVRTQPIPVRLDPATKR